MGKSGRNIIGKTESIIDLGLATNNYCVECGYDYS